MKEKQEEKKLKQNKFFVLGAIAFVVLLLVVSIAEMICIFSLNKKVKNQEAEMDKVTNELNYYKDKTDNPNDNDFYEGTVA